MLTFFLNNNNYEHSFWGQSSKPFDKMMKVQNLLQQLWHLYKKKNSKLINKKQNIVHCIQLTGKEKENYDIYFQAQCDYNTNHHGTTADSSLAESEYNLV